MSNPKNIISPFSTFSTEKFPWVIRGVDDFSCKVGDYFFRVEKMDNSHWWWRVYYKNEPIPEYTNEYSNSKYRAIGYCEGLYMGHSLSTKNIVK
jgi:hypothetical protein